MTAEQMTIRTATKADLDDITQVEEICFSEAEAASRESFLERLIYYPDHFWLLTDQKKLVGFVNGMVTEEADLRDEMYKNAKLHDENGSWQMIFGVDTIPQYRRQGCAKRLLDHVIRQARLQKRRGLVLTCKEKLIPYYAKFGFVDEGISGSVHGNVVWHQMRLTF